MTYYLAAHVNHVAFQTWYACLPASHVMVAGVMACSQEVSKGDLVAVSVAMEAAGREGYITRGSVIGSDPRANPSFYVGKSQSYEYQLQQRSSCCFARARNDQATYEC